MRVLIACEESQRVCIAFREKGHEAYSCDIQECSGGHPEWHIHDDVLNILNKEWDLIIAHPPCTYLSCVGNRWFDIDKYGEKAIDRLIKRAQAAAFFMKFVHADCKKIAIENPVGYMSSFYRKPDQIINPYEFAVCNDDNVSKKTCLWLKGLPLLKASNDQAKPVINEFYSSGKRKTWEDSYSRDSKVRSKTFLGIALAMAEQWG